MVGTYHVKEVKKITASTAAIGSEITSQFTVTITDSCNADVLSVTNNIVDFPMNFGATQI
jgi:hypothetical protein